VSNKTIVGLSEKVKSEKIPMGLLKNTSVIDCVISSVPYNAFAKLKVPHILV